MTGLHADLDISMEASIAESLQGEGAGETEDCHWNRNSAGSNHKGGQAEGRPCRPHTHMFRLREGVLVRQITACRTAVPL